MPLVGNIVLVGALGIVSFGCSDFLRTRACDDTFTLRLLGFLLGLGIVYNFLA